MKQALRALLCLGWLPVQLLLAQAALAVQLEPVLTGLSNPVFVTGTRDGSNRLFIVEQAGVIKVVQPGQATPTLFLDIGARVLSGGEQGLLGLAFHPQYSSNWRFFVNYTRRPDGATVVAEYRVSAADPDVASTDESVLLVIAQPFANHNAGMIEFGPDGFLYIPTGDGGSANDPGNRAQNVEELLGKMLRIDVDRPAGPLPYSSPPGNPYFGATPGRDEIFAIGFRNPFRCSFDRFSGQLWCSDVGQGQREEVDIVQPGGNYGWRVLEGTRCTGLGPGSCEGTGFIAPVAEYDHGGGRCSITGGYVYRGSRGALPAGAYVFGDFCSGEIFQFHGGIQSLLIDTDLSISSFGIDDAGELYVVDLGGTVHRLVGDGTPAAAGDIVAHLEEPVNAGVAAGVGNIRGWAVSLRPIVRVELYIDGAMASIIPYGGTRPDVARVFPGFPDPASSGFSMAYNFANLSAGPHTMMVRIVDDQGSQRDAASAFHVVRFASSFIADPGDVNLTGATATMLDANTFRLGNVVVQGVSHTLILRWSTAAQGFSVVGIE